MSHNDKRCSRCPEIKLKDDKAFKNHSHQSTHKLKTKHWCSFCKYSTYFDFSLWEHMLKEHKDMKIWKYGNFATLKIKSSTIKEN